jgi:LysM repeat protein
MDPIARSPGSGVAAAVHAPVPPRWQRVSRDLQPLKVGNATSTSDETNRAEPDQRLVRRWGAWLAASSPLQQRRAGDHRRTRLGVLIVAGASLLTAGVLWVGAGEYLPAAAAREPASGRSSRAGQGLTGHREALPLPEARPTTLSPAGTGSTISPIPTAGTSSPEPTPAPILTAQPTPAETPRPTAAPAETAVSRANSGSSPQLTGRQYVVQPGDTLFSIARRNGTTVDAMVVANRLVSRDAVLPVGQRLVIP